MAMSGCIGRIQPPTCRIGRRNLLAPPPRTGLQFLRRTPTLPLLRTLQPPPSTAVHNESEASVEAEEEGSVLKMSDLFGVLTKNLGLIWWVLITSEAEELKLKMQLQSLRETNKTLQREYKLVDLMRRFKALTAKQAELKGEERNYAYSELVARLPPMYYSAWLNDPAGHLPQKLPKLVIVMAHVFVGLLMLKTMFECIPPKLVIRGTIALFVLHVAQRLESKLILKDMFIDSMKTEKLILENEVLELERKNKELTVEIYKAKKELATDTVG